MSERKLTPNHPFIRQMLDEINNVYEILKKYCLIHDNVFKTSFLRQLFNLSFLSLFKSLDKDYGQFFRELDLLASELTPFAALSTPRYHQNEIHFHDYVVALLKTVKCLRDICGTLDAKSRGDLQDYTITQYKSDLSTYEALRQEYIALGSKVNDLHVTFLELSRQTSIPDSLRQKNHSSTMI